jgi:aryl sulfotransferase
MAHVRSWLGQSQIPVHLVTYQNLVAAPAGELEKILDFLGVRTRAERIAHAVERSSMKSMAALEEQEVEKGIEGVFFNKKLSTGYSQGHRFINKGYKNSYDQMLTTEERAKVDAMFGSEIARYFAPSP